MGYKNDLTFQRGLQLMGVTESEAAKVLKARGKVFDDYISADNYCQEEMYPPEVQGMVPRAPGSFSRTTVQGLRVYVPQTPTSL
jgi:hypothetical protein